MAEIAVTMFDVDEIETAVLGALGGNDVVVDQPLDLVVADHRPVGRITEFAVEQRMIVGDDGFEFGVVVRLAEAARMRQLQPDHEIAVVAGRFPVRLDDDVAQGRDLALAFRGHGELLRIGAPVEAHRAGLAAPDQFGAAEPETPPAPPGVLRRPAVALAIPTLHRLDRQAMSDFHAVDFDRRRQRRFRAVRDDVVAWHLEAERLQIVAKAGDTIERANLGIVTELHFLLPSCRDGAAAIRLRAP